MKNTIRGIHLLLAVLMAISGSYYIAFYFVFMYSLREYADYRNALDSCWYIVTYSAINMGFVLFCFIYYLIKIL